MSASRIACPRCKTVLSSQQVLPAGRLLQCAKCATRFRVPKAVKVSGEARGKGPPKPAAGKPVAKKDQETKAPAPTTKSNTPPANASPPPAAKSVNGTSAATRMVCPACQAAMRFPGAVPIGKSVRCAKCATVFRYGQSKSMLTRETETKPKPAKPTKIKPASAAPPPKTARPTQLAKDGAAPPTKPSRPAKPTKLAGGAKDEHRPVTLLVCACGARTKVTGAIPPGLAIPCPRCRRRLAVPTAKKTTLAGNKPATMLVPPAKPTQVAPGPAKKTQLAPSSKPKESKPAAKAPTRLNCPACKAVLRFPGPVPVGKPIKCPKCTRIFRLQPKGKPATPPKTLTSMPAAKEKVKSAAAPKTLTAMDAPAKPAPAKSKSARPAPRRRPAARWRYAAGGVMLSVVALAAFWLGRSLWSNDIPEADWIEFAPPGGACSVRMPGEPEETTAESPAVVSHKFTVRREIVLHGYTGVPVGTVEKAFMLEYSDRLDGVPTFDRAYAATRDAVLRHAEGQVVAEQDVTLGPYRGKEFLIQPQVEGTVVGRFCLVKNRTYLLLAVGPYLQPGKGDVARFFDSFRIQ